MKKSMKNMGRIAQKESNATSAWNARSAKILLLIGLSFMSNLDARLDNDDLAYYVDDGGDHK